MGPSSKRKGDSSQCYTEPLEQKQRGRYWAVLSEATELQEAGPGRRAKQGRKASPSRRAASASKTIQVVSECGDRNEGNEKQQRVWLVGESAGRDSQVSENSRPLEGFLLVSARDRYKGQWLPW